MGALKKENDRIRSIICMALSTRPNTAALIGFLLAIPFVVTNAIVGTRFEPIYSMLGSTGALARPFPVVYILIALGLTGAYVAAIPMLRKGIDGERHFYLLNIVVSVALLIGFLVIGTMLGSEDYRCNVLDIPNCD